MVPFIFFLTLYVVPYKLKYINKLYKMKHLRNVIRLGKQQLYLCIYIMYCQWISASSLKFKGLNVKMKGWSECTVSIARAVATTEDTGIIFSVF